MQLLRFRVTNFRSVVDSGWIEADRVTAFIGINESGKTNLLLPLWKLNPARDGEIVPTSDYPKTNYAAVRENPSAFIFIRAEFHLGDIAKNIAALTGHNHQHLEQVQISRDFGGGIEMIFPNFALPKTIDREEILNLIADAATELEAIPPLAKEGSLREEMQAILRGIGNTTDPKSAFSANELTAIQRKLSGALPEVTAPTSSLVPRFKGLLEALGERAASLSVEPPHKNQAAVTLITQHLPTFVYYSNYGNLDSEIYLPHVVQNLKRDDLGTKEAGKARTLRVLFRFVRLEPEEILEMGQEIHAPGRAPTEAEIQETATRKRERTILLHSAGADLTRRFGEWWKQGDYTFDFEADGDHFRIWVSDKNRPAKIELEDRSTGLQWFLSFYLVFLVESEQKHRNAILLLDEPGLSLHPLAQRDLSAFFEGLAATNQIIYTTHSPFLVDADMLDRARKVYMDADGSTKASADLRRGEEDPRKSGATYAIYSAHNMNIAESMLYGCSPVIVEGPSDQHYLTAIKVLLIGKEMISPRRELVFPPAHGASSVKAVASILAARNDGPPFVLLDGDDAGRKMAKDITNGSYQSSKDRVLSTDSYVSFTNSEVEDLIPLTFLADVIDRWERRPDKAFAEVVNAGQPIVPQIEAWFKSYSVTPVEGWKVDLSREFKRRALAAKDDAFSPETLATWAKLFKAFAPADILDKK
jgi:hypothetical protein